MAPHPELPLKEWIEIPVFTPWNKKIIGALTCWDKDNVCTPYELLHISYDEVRVMDGIEHAGTVFGTNVLKPSNMIVTRKNEFKQTFVLVSSIFTNFRKQ